MADGKELEWLRELRRYVDAHPTEEIDAQWSGILEFEQSGKADSIDGHRQLLQMMDDAHRCSETVKLYKIMLDGAEKAEREEKGGAAEYARRMKKTALRRLAGIYNA